MATIANDFFTQAVNTVYRESDLGRKIVQARRLAKQWASFDTKLLEETRSTPASKEVLEAYSHLHDPRKWILPARPLDRPKLCERIPGHKELGIPQTAHIMHTLAHIELNAVDMYLDTVIRFGWKVDKSTIPYRIVRVLPEECISDMMSIVDDEARHFTMVANRLEAMTHELRTKLGKPDVDVRYGAIPATTLLWQLGVNTRNDFASRVAVIPLSQEARGLDATPRFVQRLNSGNDHESASIVGLIGREEVRHVALGLKWLAWEAIRVGRVTPSQQLGADDISSTISGIKLSNEDMEQLGSYWQELVSPHFPDGMFPPFNRVARSEAGMPESWYAPLCRTEPTFTDDVLSNPQQSHLPTSRNVPGYVAKYVEKNTQN